MVVNVAVKMMGIVVIMLVAVGIMSGGVFLRSWEQDYLHALQERVEIFAQNFLDDAHRLESQTDMKPFDLQTVSATLSAACEGLFASPISQKLALTNISVLNRDGVIVADARQEMVGRAIDDAVVRKKIGWRKVLTIRRNEKTHILFPLVSAENKDVGTVDIGVSDLPRKAAFKQLLKRIAAMFGIMISCLAVLAYFFFYFLVTKPIRYLASVSHSMIEGRFFQSIYFAKRRDELADLAKALVELSMYFQDMTLLAQQISNGSLTGHGQSVQKRSKRDVLGVALQEMLSYLQTVADGAKRIAEGDVRSVIPLRADTDALGRALHQMMNYLNEMADTATLISTGDLRSQVVPRSERDVLGSAFANMTTYLHTLADSATAIADGNLKHKVQPQSSYDILGNAFYRMAEQLRENFDHIQQEMAERIRAQEALQRLNEELEARVEERTAEIVRQKYILDTFMESVPDSIYFKDRASRFIHVNGEIARRFGIKEPSECIGKNDFDFFEESVARPKYEQEQAIIRTGQPLLNLEEPDPGGCWALTTKMPLRDEHGEIIGTFGISRDITPLKIAQHQVEDAYAEIQKLNEQLRRENVRMGAELDVSRRIQQMMLPAPEELRHIQGIEIIGFMQPADEVGGDYYDVLNERGTTYIGIGDVTGHGLESGILMLMTQTAIRTLVERGETDPTVFLNTLNRVLYQNIQRMGIDRSLTLTMVKYQNGQLRLLGQHEEALVARSDGRIERVDTLNLGFPLGLLADIRRWVAETTVTLAPGDGLVLYTDGITEAQNAVKEFYGLERLCAVVSAHWGRSAEAVKEAIVEDLRAFVGDALVYDDVTLVVLKQQ